MGYDLSVIPGSDESEACAGMRIGAFSMEPFMRLLAGVIDWETEHPPFPQSYPDAEGDWDGDGEPMSAAARKHRAAVDRVVRTPSKFPGYVPGFKFVTNDGWIVSAAESKILLDEARAIRASETHPRWAALVARVGTDGAGGWLSRLDEFIAFAEIAAAEGGFNVY